VLICFHSNKRSSELSRTDEPNRISESVKQSCPGCFRHRERAGRMREAARPADNLKRQCAIGESCRKIYTIAPLGKIQFQETSVLEAKYASPCRFKIKELVWARATAGSRRIIIHRPNVVNGKGTQRTSAGETVEG
jgi:hypothetical protein